MLKHEEPRLDPQNSGKHLMGAAATCQLRMQEAGGGIPGASWLKGPAGLGEHWVQRETLPQYINQMAIEEGT